MCIKICGVTSVQDARFVVASGANALGLVFYPDSPRHVSIETAQAIVTDLPPFITSVGLFVDPEAADVRAVLSAVPLSVLQFHGDESEAFCSQFGRPYLKAVRVRSQQDILQALSNYPTAAALLLDAYDAKQKGGSGQTFDWRWIPQKTSLPLVIAGGLTAENVGDLLAVTQPYAVDVCSGVEQSKGVKSRAKIEAFCQAVRSYG